MSERSPSAAKEREWCILYPNGHRVLCDSANDALRVASLSSATAQWRTTWLTMDEVGVPVRVAADRLPDPTEPHEFVGRLDRWCEICNKPDRDSIHASPVSAAVSPPDDSAEFFEGTLADGLDDAVPPAEPPEPLAERLAKAEGTLGWMTTVEEWPAAAAANILTNAGREGIIALLREAREALRV